MRALRYFFAEARASLWRRRRSAGMAVLTIAAGAFVLGFFLALNTNIQRLLTRWGETAELSVYLADDLSMEQRDAIDRHLRANAAVGAREYLSKDDALERFRQVFPDLAEVASRMPRNPLPASFEVRLHTTRGGGDAAVESLVASVRTLAGVSDVRYDRRWISRLETVLRIGRGLGIFIVAMLSLAGALTVANVVRLAAVARSDEIQVMQLVGAPIAYVRGPFIAEGLLQGGAGALIGVVLLWGVALLAQARYGAAAAEILGGGVVMLSPWATVAIVLGGMLVGSLGGYIAARGVKDVLPSAAL